MNTSRRSYSFTRAYKLSPPYACTVRACMIRSDAEKQFKRRVELKFRMPVEFDSQNACTNRIRLAIVMHAQDRL